MDHDQDAHTGTLSRTDFLKLAGAGLTAATVAPWKGIADIASAASVDSPAGIKGGTLIWGKPAELLEFDPQVSGNGVSWQIMFMVYEQLVTIQGHLKIVPGLAESWHKVSPTTYIFHLRRNVHFSNGRQMTADDVVGSFHRLLSPKLAAFWGQTELKVVKRVSKVDAHTVRFDLQHPYTPFLAALAAVATSILPMKELNDKSFDPTKEMLGTGPFKVAAHHQDESWRLVRNPHYWRHGHPVVNQVVAQIVPDDSARLAGLRNGTLHIALFENPDSPRLLQAIPNVKTFVQATTDYYRVDVNAIARKSIFRDVRVRRAFSMALNRHQIVQIGLSHLGEVSAAVAPSFGAVDFSRLRYSQYNPNAAKALLKAARTSLNFSLIASPSFPEFVRIAEVMQQNIADIGGKVNILQLDAGTWEKRVFSSNPGQFDAAISYFAGYADPGMVLYNWNPHLAGFNIGFLQNDQQLVRMIDHANALPDGHRRNAALQAACARIDADANMLTLATRPVVFGYRKDLLRANLQPVEGYVDSMRNAQDFVRVK